MSTDEFKDVSRDDLISAIGALRVTARNQEFAVAALRSQVINAKAERDAAIAELKGNTNP